MPNAVCAAPCLVSIRPWLARTSGRKGGQQVLRPYEREGKDSRPRRRCDTITIPNWCFRAINPAINRMVQEDPTDARSSGQTQSAAQIGLLLRATANGDVETVRSLIQADSWLVAAKERHPFWGGEPQALQVAAE